MFHCERSLPPSLGQRFRESYTPPNPVNTLLGAGIVLKRGGLYTREMGSICPFGVFPLFYRFVASKLATFPLKRREFEKAIFGPKKDKWSIRGSKTPKPPEMPLKQGKRHNATTGLATWIAPKLGQKVL